jgi:citronellol/citronellal dehydrogenase
MQMSLAGKTIFMSGGSRGIGLAIALRAARDGANIAVAAKTAEPHAKLEGTIYTAAEQIDKAGGRALPLVVDIRDEERVAEAVRDAADKFGGIDILINNASAIRTTGWISRNFRISSCNSSTCHGRDEPRSQLTSTHSGSQDIDLSVVLCASHYAA